MTRKTTTLLSHVPRHAAGKHNVYSFFKSVRPGSVVETVERRKTLEGHFRKLFDFFSLNELGQLCQQYKTKFGGSTPVACPKDSRLRNCQ